MESLNHLQSVRSLKCEFCNFKTIKEDSLIQHLRKHEHVSNFKIPCPNCPQFFKRFNTFYKHRRRCYGKIRTQAQESQDNAQNQQHWSCHVENCTFTVTPEGDDDSSFVLAQRHCYQHLRSTENVTIKCPVCDKAYERYKSFAWHMNTHRARGQVKLIVVARPQEVLDDAIECFEELDFSEAGESTSGCLDRVAAATEELQEVTVHDIWTLNSRLKRNEAMFILKMISKHLLSQSAVDDIVSFAADLHSQKLNVVLDVLNYQLENYIAKSKLQEIDCMIRLIDNVTGMSGSLSSVDSRNNYFKKMFRFIEPVKIELGNNRFEEAFYFYFPLKETLQRLLEVPEVRENALFLNPPKPQETSVYGGFQHGRVFHDCLGITGKLLLLNFNLKIFEIKKTQNFPCFSGPCILLRLYLDGFGMNNPLSSRADKNKVVGIYYTLLHDLRFSAKRNTVQTVGLINDKDVHFFGLEYCLDQLLRDLKDLINNNLVLESGEILQVRLISVLGDNLELNSVVGMKANFSKLETACRKCLCTHTQLLSSKTYDEIHEQENDKRTLAMFDADLTDKDNMEVSHVNGVSEKSPFRDIPYFDLSLQVTHCYSHDLFEGCLKTWLLLILEHFISKKWLNWDSLEGLLSQFPYHGRDAVSHPAPMRAKKMKQKASRRIVGTFSEMATLMKLFTQIFYDVVKDTSDPYWIWVLEIRELVRYVHMSRMSENQVILLDDAVRKVMSTRMELTRKNSSDEESSLPTYEPRIKWKEHFISHYASEIKNLAPMPLLCTDLFESKHAPFKTIKRQSKNSRNLLLTLSQKSEFQATYLYEGSFFQSKFEKHVSGILKDADVLTLCQKQKNLQRHAVFLCSSLEYHGTPYRLGSFVILPKMANDLPSTFTFGKIEMLLFGNESAFLYVERYNAFYDESFDLYMLQTENVHEVVSVEQLEDFYPLEGYLVGEEKALSISLRHYPFDTMN